MESYFFISLFKNGGRCDPSNYNPILLLPILIKILKKIEICLVLLCTSGFIGEKLRKQYLNPLWKYDHKKSNNF